MNRRHTAYKRHKLRHIIASLLGLLGLWIFSLTGAIEGLHAQFSQLTQHSQLAVSLFPLTLEADVYGLLPSSGLLLSSGEVVFAQMGQAVELSYQEPLLTPLNPSSSSQWDSPIEAQGDDDDTETPSLTVAQADDVINYTAGGDAGGNYIWADSIYVADRTDNKNLTADDILPLMDGDYTLESGAKILIIHTHGTEAYTPVGTDIYLESDPYRTTDNQQNIIQVGNEMASYFRQAGFQVLHDTNLYDYPNYNSSYANSRIAVQQWLEQYPDIALILDVHRDALTTQDGTPYRLVGEDGDTAQLMLVVGSDESTSHPNWEENFSLALQLQQQLTTDWGDLIRPTTLRSSRYNQDLSTAFLLVEVGGHGNSLQDARKGALCFAQSLVTALTKEG